jgi:5-methylcytosine-specific restriction endonuclease McrA
MLNSLTHKGQVYVKTDTIIPYVKRDGTETSLAVWYTDCPDCGSRFEIMATARRKKLWQPNRRCPACHRPGAAVG